MKHPIYGLTELYFKTARATWFVNYNVPKALQEVLTNSKGKPLKRKEKSTGTSDEKIARKRHPLIQAELFAELDRIRLKNPTEEIKKGLSETHKELTKAINTKDPFVEIPDDLERVLISGAGDDWFAKLSMQKLSEKILESKGLSIDNLDLVMSSLTKVIEDVQENEKRKQEFGYFNSFIRIC